MESALLSPSRFVTSQDRELGGYLRHSQTSFCGNLITCPTKSGKNVHIRHGSGSGTVFAVFGRRKAVVKKETVIPDPDYRIPIVLLGAAGGLAYTNNIVPAVPVGLLGLLLLFQTTRVRFVFEDDALEVKVGDQLDDSGENAFVGGKNRWKFSSFVNWEFWWPNFPVLVYFKETQTKPEGQIHFFPIIFAIGYTRIPVSSDSVRIDIGIRRRRRSGGTWVEMINTLT